jgi:cysteine desulfurase/selenocysteine lyase
MSEAFSSYYFVDEARAGTTRLGSFVAARSATGDVGAARADFPALHQRVNGHPLAWFDNAATTQKPRVVLDAMTRFYERDNSNVHRGAHALAARATDAYEDARATVARLLGASSPEEIVFVRGTTEGVNLLANTLGRSRVGAGDEIVLTTLEHHANIVPWQLLAQSVGARLRPVPVDDSGQVQLDAYAALLTDRTKIVALSHVSNALGTVLPVDSMIAMAKARGIPVVVDGAQAVAHLPVDVTALGADFYIFSGHKIFGPTGIGAVYGRRDLLAELPPWQGGGSMIRDVTFEHTTYSEPPARFEAGTPSIGDAVGLGAAIRYVLELGLPAIAAREDRLARLLTDVLADIPRVRIIGTATHKVAVASFVVERLSHRGGRPRPRRATASRCAPDITARSPRYAASAWKAAFGRLWPSTTPKDEVHRLGAALRRMVRKD